MVVAGAVLIFAAAVQTADTPQSLIAGRVIDAVSRRPIAGVVVTPVGSAVPPNTSPSVRTPAVLTNANGQFVLRGLRSGVVFLTAVKGGYVNATYNQRRPGGSGQYIPIEDGQRVTDLEIRMWKHGVISGTIVDEAGDSVVGTRVVALGTTFVAGRRRAVTGPFAVTDDRGMYRIADLTPGDYMIVVPSTQTSVPTDVMESFFTGVPMSDAKRMDLGRELRGIGAAVAPAGSTFGMRAGDQTISLPPGTLTPIASATGMLVYPTVYYPAAPTPAQAATIAVQSGQERNGVDVQVQPFRGVRVSGVLIGPDGPSATTGVHLVLGGDAAIEPLEAAAALTDAAGAFTFPAVPAGEYELRVVRVPRSPPDPSEAGRITTTPSGAVAIASRPSAPTSPPPIPADATLVANIPLTVGDRDLTDVIVPLVPGPRVTGRLEFEGTTEPPTSASIAHISIALAPADGTHPGDPALGMQSGRADESGQFKTYGFPPGRYVLRTAAVPEGWFLKSAMYQGRDIADMPLELGSKDADGVVITFTDRPSRLTGVVHGPNGPDPAAIVIAYPVDSAAWTSSGAMSRRMRTTRAGKDGAYSMASLPAGEYYLVAVQEDRVWEWQDPALLQALSRVAQTIRLVDGDQKTVDLRSAEIQ